MFRVFCSIYLVIATLAGPNLCCCALTRLMARSGQAIHEQATAARSCCCKTSQAAPALAAQHSCCNHSSSTPDERHCACHEQQATLPAIDSATVNLQKELAVQALTSVSLLLTSPVDSGWLANPEGATQSLPDAAFLTAWDLLHVHHLLRC